MTDQQFQQTGYAKVSAPPLALAATSILAWAMKQYGNTDVPADIQLDIATVLSMLFVYLIPHNLSLLPKGNQP